MNWIFEGPWPILLTGVILEAVLVIALVRTGRLVLLWSIVAVGAVTGGLLVLERAIVTDNESIRETLDGLAAAAVAGDLDGVLSYVDPEAKEVRQMATDAMRRYKIREAKIADLAIRVTQQGGAPSALATFIGRFRVGASREALGHEVALVRLRIGLVKRGERWLIVSVDRREAQHP